MGSGSRTLHQRFPCDLIIESGIDERDSAFVNASPAHHLALASRLSRTWPCVRRRKADAHSTNTMDADVASAATYTIPPPAPVSRKTNAHLPPLPFDHYKVVFRPRDGLNLGAWPQPFVAQAIVVAAGLDAAVLNELIIRIRTDQNLAVISASYENLTTQLQKAPILNARMMGSTSQTLVTFSGIQICSVCLSMGHRADVCPTPDRHRCVVCGTSNPLPEHECTPKCIHCGGDHPGTDPRCPLRQQRPFNKSYVLQERLKREKLCPPTGSADSQPRTTAGSLRNPYQPIKTPENSAEQPPTSGRNSTRGPPGHYRQVDRGRPDNPSKERTAGCGHPKQHGQQKEKPAMCLAVIDNTDALVASATLRTTGSGSAEEGAIALAIVHASTSPSEDAPVTTVTDSRAACRAFAQGLVAAHTHTHGIDPAKSDDSSEQQKRASLCTHTRTPLLSCRESSARAAASTGARMFRKAACSPHARMSPQAASVDAESRLAGLPSR
ncbi:hypothetical protein HPB49_009656 [Dermacentor silvarum]|uniref:Uncharacterized protein n=1 Tax=Dermacentor silvarum TaxID=543639 RepID=A0ACB8DCA0_DERSI|nr:hypothetical protein HPB49_009656 [Dermacentor silvarum]